MKRFAIALFLALAVPSGLILTAQESAVAAAVRAVDASWRQAYVACDATAWDALLADDLTFIHKTGSIGRQCEASGRSACAKRTTRRFGSFVRPETMRSWRRVLMIWP